MVMGSVFFLFSGNIELSHALLTVFHFLEFSAFEDSCFKDRIEPALIL